MFRRFIEMVSSVRYVFMEPPDKRVEDVMQEEWDKRTQEHIKKILGKKPDWRTLVYDRHPHLPVHKVGERVIICCEWDVLAQKDNGEVYTKTFTIEGSVLLHGGFLGGYSKFFYSCDSSGAYIKFFEQVDCLNREMRLNGFSNKNGKADFKMTSFVIDGVDVFEGKLLDGFDGLQKACDILAMLDGFKPWYE